MRGYAGKARQDGGIDNTGANGFRYMSADQHRAGKFADAGGYDRVANGYGPGADRVGHGIGHIVGTDIPGHVQSQD
jgi:hypothetical protein